MNEEFEKIKERAQEVIAAYEKKKATVRKEVGKEYAKTIRDLENERIRRENVVKNKLVEIDKLQSSIESLKNKIFGLESKSKLWEHECARMSDIYHRTIQHYSNPGLIEVQLQVIFEYTDALVRLVKKHKWGKDTAAMAVKYRESINKKLHELVGEIRNNSEEDLSLDSARKKIDAGLGKDASPT